jgi:hypothetical protein
MRVRHPARCATEPLSRCPRRKTRTPPLAHLPAYVSGTGPGHDPGSRRARPRCQRSARPAGSELAGPRRPCGQEQRRDPSGPRSAPLTVAGLSPRRPHGATPLPGRRRCRRTGTPGNAAVAVGHDTEVDLNAVAGGVTVADRAASRATVSVAFRQAVPIPTRPPARRPSRPGADRPAPAGRGRACARVTRSACIRAPGR